MATFQLSQRTNKPRKDGRFPIIFQIYLADNTKIITLPFACKKEEWDALNKKFKQRYPNYKVINETLRIHEIKLQSVIDALEAKEENYSLEDVRTAYLDEVNQSKPQRMLVGEFMLERVKKLKEEKRTNYANSIKDTHSSLFKFANKKLTFKQITPKLLDDYEHFLRKTCTNGGIAVRMRDIRAIYNLAIRHKCAADADYPFKIYKISKLKGKSRKIAIVEEEFMDFKSFDIGVYPNYRNTYKLFLFSYYSGGMNFRDMAYLKWENISNNRLMYSRGKTKAPFNLKLHKEALSIIDYFKKNLNPENPDFVFPIIHKANLTENQEEGRYKRQLRKFNKQLKFIAKTVGINKNLTSYVARHSFATHLKYNDVSETIISELMGHSDVCVTQAYLQDFGSDVLDDALGKLN